MEMILKIIFWISLFCLSFSYVIYPLILLVIKNIVPKRKKKKMKELPAISIIVSCYNEEKVIESRIKNFLALDYPKDKMEIIIASDGSDDKTVEIASQYETDGITVYDFKDRRGKVNVLNDCIERAKNPILIFTDANTMFARDVLKKLVQHYGDEKVGSVCGGLQFVNADGSRTAELEGIYWRYESFMKKVEGRMGALLGANGGIYSIRKDLFDPCEPDTIIEDFMIPMKILMKGYLNIYEPEAHAIEEAAQKIVQEKKRRIRIGVGGFQALFRLLGLFHPKHGFVSVAFFSHKVLRWFAPFFLIFVFVSNYFLIHVNLFFKYFFFLQTVFYAMALLGQSLTKAGIHVKLFNICYYFVSMNLALFIGFFKYLFKTQKVTWERTER